MRTGFTRRQWLLLLTVSLGSFVTFLDLTITNIAMPTIIADLGTTLTRATWVLNAYTLGVAALLLSVGRIADHHGQKRVFVIGLVVFTLASLACGLSGSIDELIAFRAVQSLGAAALIPLSFSILVAGFTDRAQQTAVTGFYGALSAAAAALGPTLGGILTQYASWHWIFFVNVPVGFAAVLLGLAFVPERRVASEERFDVPGTALVSGGLFLLVLALVQGNDWGWRSPAIVGSFVGAGALLGGFILWELHTSSPLFDLRLFRVRPFAAASGGLFALSVGVMGAQLMLILFMTGILGFSELKAAMCITPMPIVAMALMPVVPKLIRTAGPRLSTGLGAVAMAVGLASLTMLSPSSSVLDIVVRTMVIGAGLALMMVPLMTVGLLSLPEGVGGAGSGALNTARQVGFAVGVAVLVSILTASSGTRLPSAKAAAGRYVAGNAALATQGRAQLTRVIAQVPGKLGGDSKLSAAAMTTPTKGVPAEVAALSRMGGGLDTLVQQSGKLAGGLRQLSAASSRLAAGSTAGAGGSRDLSRGMTKLQTAAGSLSSGTAQVSAGASTFAGSLAGAAPQAAALASGGSRLSAGAIRLAGGLSAAGASSDRLSAASRKVSIGARRVASGTASLSGGLGTLASSAGQLQSGAQSLESLLASLAASDPSLAGDARFQQAVGTAQALDGGAGQLVAGLDQASMQSGALAAGATQVAGGASSVAVGASRLGAALATASTSAGALAAGSRSLAAGSGSLSNGLVTAARGASSLSSAASQAAAGAAALHSGVAGAAGGAHRVDAGAQRVSAGARKLDKGTAAAAAATGRMSQATSGAALMDAAAHVKKVILDAATSSFDASFWLAAVAAFLCLPLAVPLGRTLPQGEADAVAVEAF